MTLRELGQLDVALRRYSGSLAGVWDYLEGVIGRPLTPGEREDFREIMMETGGAWAAYPHD